MNEHKYGKSLPIKFNSRGWGCHCVGTPKEKQENYVVVTRNGNHSAFETPKYGFHPGDYSDIMCVNCGRS